MDLFCIYPGMVICFPMQISVRQIMVVGGMKRMTASDIIQVGKISMDNGIILTKMVGCKQAGCRTVEIGTIFPLMVV